SFPAVVVLASTSWLVWASRNSEAARRTPSSDPFKGKVLLVSTGTMSVFVLEKAQMQNLGDRSWLVGQGALEGRMGGWYKGRTLWLRMEQINSITEFGNVMDAKKALESGAGMPFGVVYGGYGQPQRILPAKPVENKPLEEKRKE